MKKALISLLSILLLAGLFIAGYIFLWTPENLVKWGDRKMADGYYEAAAERYEIAVSKDPQNHGYVMALIEAYAAEGNYTKAERALVTAIRAKPTAALYCKLSELYVEQNKLLDSQLMLDTITDPMVREEVESLRPAAPIFSHESGSYDTHIAISITCHNGTIYHSVNSDYPSSHSDPYSQPIELSSGKTNIQAIVVGDNGLVSPMTVGDYHIVGIVEEVLFQSPELEAMIREQLYIPRTEKVQSSDLWEITTLKFPEAATTLGDLQYFTALTELDLQGCAIEDYSPLTTVPQLEILNLAGNLVSSEALDHIGTLTKLKNLNLSGCGVSGISALAPLIEMEYLDLSDNSINDIAPLADMDSLITLNLRANAVSTLEPLQGLSTLKEFNISFNSIPTLAPLQESMHMQILHAESNKLQSVGALGHMADLSVLVVSNNQLEDISALGNCSRMTELRVNNNFLTGIDAIAKMPMLTELDCSYNEITSLPALDPMCHLQKFNAAHNQIPSVGALAGLAELTEVNIDYNEPVEDIEVLSSCPLLVQINAFGTHVIEVKKLTDMGVIVNFDPSYADREE